MEDLLQGIEDLTPEERNQFLENISQKGWYKKHQSQMGLETEGRNGSFGNKQRGHQISSVGEKVEDPSSGPRVQGRGNKIAGEFQV